jgi:hypothetical protein
VSFLLMFMVLLLVLAQTRKTADVVFTAASFYPSAKTR